MASNWLAERLSRRETLLVPGAFDAFSSRLVSLSGHEAVYAGGYAALAAAHGLPDLGIAGRTDMVEIHRRISNVSEVPVIVDADTGYGGPLSVRQTVTELAAIGVGAIQIEDQVNPKRCGHVDHKEVVSMTEACLRVRVAVDSAASTGTAIVARTDSLQTHGLDHAIERANRFLDCGATAVFIDAPQTLDQVVAIPAGISGPVVYNAAATGTGLNLGVTELGELGYRVVIFPIEAFLAAMSAVTETLRTLKRDGWVDAPSGLSFQQTNAILGLPELISWERNLVFNECPPTYAEAFASRPATNVEGEIP